MYLYIQRAQGLSSCVRALLKFEILDRKVFRPWTPLDSLVKPETAPLLLIFPLTVNKKYTRNILLAIRMFCCNPEL